MRKRTIILFAVVSGFLGKAEAQKGEKSIAAGVLVAAGAAACSFPDVVGEGGVAFGSNV